MTDRHGINKSRTLQRGQSMKERFMEKGINLSLTKSLADFDTLLEDAIKAVRSQLLLTEDDLFRTGYLSKFEIDALLAGVDTGESSKNKYSRLDLEHERGQFKFRLRKHVEICAHESRRPTDVCWIVFGWEENERRESNLWIEFNAIACSAKNWDKLHLFVGDSGKYCSKIVFEFVKTTMNAWITFYLKDEYLKQFYDENVDLKTQREILTGFID